MDRRSVKLAPSILDCDFGHLAPLVEEAAKAGADRIHIDVMDGHFVRNISMGAPIVQSVRKLTALPLETHLMISDPDFFLEEFVEAGSDSFLVHWEGNRLNHPFPLEEAFAREGDTHAIRNDRSGKNGCQHGAAPYQTRP